MDKQLIALLVVAFIKVAIMIGGMMTAAAYLVLLERWIAAWVQDRKGPNRVGIPLTKIRMFGLGQPMADGLKFILKEEYTPAHVDKVMYLVAPISILAAALAVFAVIPFGSYLPDIPQLKEWGIDGPIELLVAPGIDVGMIYVFALSSIAVYGVILGGWASNDKYSFLGGLRSSAQLIAYEIPLGLGLLGVVLMSGSLRLESIISDQAQSGVWNAFMQPLGLVVFTVASFAEAARLPFDLPEAEQELVGGYHTEYSALKLLLFLVAEFLHMIVAAFLITILFFGGWHFWGITGSSNEVTWFEAIARIVVLSVKVLLVIVFFMVVRWSWPRFRFDQLMALAWKAMLPLGLVNLVALATLIEFAPALSERMGISQNLILIGGGWATLIVGWIGASVAAPLHVDNKPRLSAHEFDAERELIV